MPIEETNLCVVFGIDETHAVIADRMTNPDFYSDETVQKHMLHQALRWVGAVTTFAAMNKAKTITWYFTPSECKYDDETVEFQEMLAGRHETEELPRSVGDAVYSIPDGYSCVDIHYGAWNSRRYAALSLGDGDGGSSALADYFVVWLD